jgi:hypothetical protein
MKRYLSLKLALYPLLLFLFSLLQSSAVAQQPGNPTAKDSVFLFLPLVVKPGTTAAPVIHSFTASPTPIQSGMSSTLTWQVTGATSLSISPGVGAVSGTSISVSPGSTTQYTLVAGNTAGSASAQVTVTGAPPLPTADGFFIVPTPDIELPTSHPTAKVDPSGGVHVAFTPIATTTAPAPPTGMKRACWLTATPATLTWHLAPAGSRVWPMDRSV